ncbi:Lrp/AsnC family transcriptional regulator [Natronorubrum sulfidifaciens]|uniref:AsnC family transcriptional regulator n=1 Tax=Natronorubrum sulfidifaciens JCM 14089 TaxID=1230460 RepID=L9W7M6_9EURY|nr:Lrp/AsnC ligand binding domain-containing protein [Natronorubrum sulfidifaciens]ELY45266.1 AsnC family transcriptional regulator [Natronorubrum sulfidifaciens JCM 14089]
MVRAFVLIDAASGTPAPVCQTVCETEEVVDAHVITGDFDVMVEVTGDDPQTILTTVTESIRPLEGVGTTRTYVCLD